MVKPDGPVPARIMIVGEAPGKEEDEQGTCFVGASGQELNRMLQEAGIMRSECFVTNVCRVRPPNNFLGHFVAFKKKDVTAAHVPLRDKMVLPVIRDGYELLLREINLVQPKVIVTVGNLSMWALTGNWGITKWRGSILRHDGQEHRSYIVPTYHPAAILRQWEWRYAAVHDLRYRVKRILDGWEPKPPAWHFTLRPNFAQVMDRITTLRALVHIGPTWIDLDLETRAGHIACCGLSWSRTECISIPFMCVENKDGYWNADEEAHILHGLYQLLTHPNAKIRWQNGLYDAQYIYRHWHFTPRGAQDTMISQHAMFSGLPKSLAFLASMYANHYVYWKDEGKDWHQKMGEDTLWSYNCMDCVYTREVGEVEADAVKRFSTPNAEGKAAWPAAQVVHDFQQRLFWPVLKAMNRGLKVNPETRDKYAGIVIEAIEEREAFLTAILGHTLNVKSPKQMHALFYNDLAVRPIMKREMKEGVMEWRPTLDDDALKQIAEREPLLRPICNIIADIRTLGIFLNTFILAQLDNDGRMRCSFNIGGSSKGKSAPVTYRLSSSENAFGGGANMQTIPSEKSKSAGKFAARAKAKKLEGSGILEFELPNIREIFGPDPGYRFFDGDLDRADLQVVVWEADDPMLKAALRMGVDIHLLNAFIITGKEPPALENLVERHGKEETCVCPAPSCYWDIRRPMGFIREFAKIFCHATNYVGSAKTVAGHTGRTVHEIDRAQAIWFGAHPGIKRWHKRVEDQIKRFRFIENKFGYRWYIFDRLDMLLPEAVAWVPQSTVGILINQIWVKIDQNLPQVEVLLQVHDALAGQFPRHLGDPMVTAIEEQAKIVIPYEDPLIIPFTVKTSDVSWGECA